MKPNKKEIARREREDRKEREEEQRRAEEEQRRAEEQELLRRGEIRLRHAAHAYSRSKKTDRVGPSKVLFRAARAYSTIALHAAYHDLEDPEGDR